MEIDSNYLAKFAKKPDRRDPCSEREYYLNLFIEKINAARIHDKFRPLPAKAIVFKVIHLKTPDLRDFFYKCEKADNFSRCFFGSLRVKPATKSHAPPQP